MHRKNALIVRFSMLSLAPLLAAAQQPGPPASRAAADSDTVVVIGKRMTREEARERAVAFVRQTGVAEMKPAARWIDPVCPRVFGLSPVHAEIVDARLRHIGAAAGVRFARKGCEANLAITFVADAPSVMKEIVARSPRRLAEVRPDEKTAMIEGGAPIRWFYTTQTRSSFGTRDGDTNMATGGGGGEGGGSVLPTSDQITTIATYRSSLISSSAHRGIIKATIVIDASRMQQIQLGSVADFAALVGLAEIRAEDPPPGESILSLFDPEGARDFTEWDAALLRGVYRLVLDREARRHRGSLVKALLEPVS